ncbi:hypothetical protein GCM10010344_78490 [Streptomyces bluensis]|nr:hypothetical protein GCM10010344_78490 [Streptomyces bluensis]
MPGTGDHVAFQALGDGEQERRRGSLTHLAERHRSDGGDGQQQPDAEPAAQEGQQQYAGGAAPSAPAPGAARAVGESVPQPASATVHLRVLGERRSACSDPTERHEADGVTMNVYRRNHAAARRRQAS